MRIKQAIEALEELVEYAEEAGFDWSLDNARAALAALRSMPQGEPVATIRYERGTPGKENDMPKVVSCNWLPDGVYSVYATPHTEAVQDDCETVDRLLKGLGLGPERCRTEGGSLNVGRTLSLLQDGCTNRCPTADLESAAMEMYERSGGKDWMREPETEKWRAIANIGFKWAKRAEAVRMSEAEILDIAKNPMTAPCSPWWLKDDVVLGDVRNAAIVFARAVEQATAARLGVKMGDV